MNAEHISHLEEMNMEYKRELEKVIMLFLFPLGMTSV